MTSEITRRGIERHELLVGRDSFTNVLQFPSILIGLNGEHARRWKPRECSQGLQLRSSLFRASSAALRGRVSLDLACSWLR